MTKASRSGRSLAEILTPLDDEPATDNLHASVAKSGVAPKKVENEGRPVPFTIFITPEDRVRLKILCAPTGLSFQKLGFEALNLLLRSKGLPDLEPTTANRPTGKTRT